MIVEVQEGKLRGVEKRSVLSNRPFWAFLGIPYAKPPIGNLRFKAPEPIEKWTGIRDASKEGNECLQLEGLPGLKKIIGNEDCLYLNVYTPEAPSDAKEQKKAVMVYIHGGGFYRGSGSAALYGPDFLVSHDVVYVSINYRLHVFGFLNTGTPSCPGNAGLKDQLLALKWVKRNIACFGGDPDNITVFGVSAGATSIHLHMLSPLSKGLFVRTIVQSGDALSHWAIEKDPESRARKIGQLAGYGGPDLEGLVQHLKNQPGEKLCEMAHNCIEDAKKTNPTRCIVLAFTPSVEKIKDDAFLPDSPEKLMQSAAPVPSIFGYTDQEGLLAFIEQPPEFLDLIISSDLSIVVEDNFRLDESQRVEMLEKIKKFYFQHKRVNRNFLKPLVELYTDLYFIRFYEAIDHLIRSDVPPYIYLFAYDGTLNFIKNIAACFEDVTNIKGACHGDDTGYLFSQSRWPANLGEEEKNMINNLCSLWTNFAKTGNPTSSLPHVDWKVHTSGRPCYLRIDKTTKVFSEKLFEERLGFWESWLKYLR